jgi:hypothetical protein
MKFHHSFLNERSLINYSNNSGSFYEKAPKRDRSISGLSQTSFFTYQPLQVAVEVEELVRAIPFGKFHRFLIAFHWIVFISSSFLAYNFCFLLMDPVYLC